MRAVVSLLEFLLWPLLVKYVLRRVPLFSLFRLTFAVWLSLMGGGVWLYMKILGPFLAKKEAEIDEGLTHLIRTASNTVSDLSLKGKTFAVQKLSSFVMKEVEKKMTATEK